MKTDPNIRTLLMLGILALVVIGAVVINELIMGYVHQLPVTP